MEVLAPPCLIILHSTSSNIVCILLYLSFVVPQTECELHEGEVLYKPEVGQTFLNMIQNPDAIGE